MSKRLKSLNGFIHDYISSEQAVTAVEFAMLAPAFMGISFMILQIGLY
jgi:Flp pilus assembly protein TadG